MKNCMSCKFFEWDEAQPGYSDWTPGSHFEMRCGVGKWKMGGEPVVKEDKDGNRQYLPPKIITQQEYFETLRTAEKCIGFTPQD